MTDDYSAVMSKKRQELPRIGGNGGTSKKVVPQGLSRCCRNAQEARIGNPSVAGSSLAR